MLLGLTCKTKVWTAKGLDRTKSLDSHFLAGGAHFCR